MNHWKEAFWMSIRLGRSRTCFRRENVLRALGAATLLVKWAASLRNVYCCRRTGERIGREPAGYRIHLPQASESGSHWKS